MTHITTIKNLGGFEVPDPAYGNLKLSVMPFYHNGGYISLPEGFKMWETALNDIMKYVPLCLGASTHYVTIDSKFFPKAEFLRREGIHADGNFCVDPNFTKETWGGVSVKGYSTPVATWGGALYNTVHKVVKDWEMPYDIEIPVGDYISSEKGGIFAVSSEVGCQGWQGTFYGDVGAEGDYSAMQGQLTEDKRVVFEKDVLYFMTSNTPHETLLIDKGKRRTFIRVTLNHEYPNKILPFMK